MALTKWNQVKKSTKSNFITFSIVIGFYIVVQLLAAAGVLTNSFSGQLVPICAYVVMAVSLNLVVGFLGELSLGHAGFMSVGAFSGTLVWVSLYDVAPHWLALILAFVVGGAMAASSLVFPFCACPATIWPSLPWHLARSSKIL